MFTVLKWLDKKTYNELSGAQMIIALIMQQQQEQLAATHTWTEKPPAQTLPPIYIY